MRNLRPLDRGPRAAGSGSGDAGVHHDFAYDGPTHQRPILDELFGPGILDTLGVAIESVPTGASEFPVITGNVAPAMTAEGAAAADATAATFAVTTLRPKKLTAETEFTHEMQATVVGLEEAVRRNLMDKMRSQMSDIVINGTAPDKSNPERIGGFLSAITAPGDPAAEAAFSDYASSHAANVDGLYALMETEVASVIGTDVYAHAASVYQSGSGESGSEALKRRSMRCVASTYIPAAKSNISNGNIYHSSGSNAGGPMMRKDSAAGIWPVLELVRDHYSKASQGILLTAIILWDAKVALRASAYRRGGVQTGVTTDEPMVEHRLAHEFRVQGRVLSGRAMVYGDVSPGYNERFLPGALRHNGRIDLNLQHDRSIVVVRGAILTDTPRELRVRAELVPVRGQPELGVLGLIRRGAINAFSIEFDSRAERREAGVRVIERADLTGLALVDRGAYPGATAEVRARSGRTMRSSVPYDKALACECIAEMGPGSGGACVPMAKFAKAAGDEMAAMMERAFAAAERDILAVAGNFRRPLGSVSKGTLRARSTDDGLEVEIDLPAGAVGDEVVAANEAAGVVIRPLIDYDRSDFTDGPDGRTVTRPHLRAFIVASTDTKAGWPDVRIDYDGENRAAPAPAGRRRVWL